VAAKRGLRDAILVGEFHSKVRSITMDAFPTDAGFKL